MFTRIALVLALIGTTATASAAAERKVAPAWHPTQAYAQAPVSAQRNTQSLYDLSARIHRDTYTHD